MRDLLYHLVARSVNKMEREDIDEWREREREKDVTKFINWCYLSAKIILIGFIHKYLPYLSSLAQIYYL